MSSLLQSLGARFGAALSMLVVLCAVLTTVSVLQARQLAVPEASALPAPAAAESQVPLRQAMRHLDQLRGLEALHLLAASGAEKRSYEIVLGGERRALEGLVGQAPASAGDAADRHFASAVRADLAAYLALQEQLIALSQRALADAATAADARQLLGGASQVVFDRLRERLDAWWTHRESRSRDGLNALRAQAELLAWGVALIGALALALAALLRWSHGQDMHVEATTWPGEAQPQRVRQMQALVEAARGNFGVAAEEAAPAIAD